MTQQLCIIGAGVTGLLMLLLLQKNGIDMSKVTIIDPYFDGGDLARRWTTIISNTPWSKTVDSLKDVFPSLVIPDSFESTQTTPLIEIAHLLRTLCVPVLKQVTQIQGMAMESNYDTTTNLWTITIESGGTQQKVQSKKLIFAQGGEPKTMNLSIPSIPLDIALDINRMKNYIKPGDKVLVFGTMHSGTIVIQNLASLGADTTAYYNSEVPFYMARDGFYDGIKAEAAEIADRIASGVIPVLLVQTKDTAKVIRTSRDAKWVVYAMGFAPRSAQVSIDGVKSSTEYDELTGRFMKGAAWGFGIAYPNRAPDGIHWDVSVAAFLEHMKAQLSKIIE
jgi:cation diffusion facilitator CzcD-associated flavoprotein CzcO